MLLLDFAWLAKKCPQELGQTAPRLSLVYKPQKTVPFSFSRSLPFSSARRWRCHWRSLDRSLTFRAHICLISDNKGYGCSPALRLSFTCSSIGRSAFFQDFPVRHQNPSRRFSICPPNPGRYPVGFLRPLRTVPPRRHIAPPGT